MDKALLVCIYITMKLLQSLLYAWFGLCLTTEVSFFLLEFLRKVHTSSQLYDITFIFELSVRRFSRFDLLVRMARLR